MDLGADASNVGLGGAAGGGLATKKDAQCAFSFDGDLLSFEGGLSSIQSDPLDSIFGENARYFWCAVLWLIACHMCHSPLLATADMESVGASAGGSSAAAQRPMRMLDMAPAWCYTGGGEKILACFDCATLPPGIQCRFGTAVVGVERVSAGVLRMRSPPCAAAGVVEPAIVDAQGQVLCTMSPFEYRMLPPPLAVGQTPQSAADTQLGEARGGASTATAGTATAAECSHAPVASSATSQCLPSSAGKRTRDSEPRLKGGDGSGLSGQLDNIFGIDGKL